jgi:FkbM family methyltransferase
MGRVSGDRMVGIGTRPPVIGMANGTSRNGTTLDPHGARARLTPRQRASRAAHVFKALTRQHHEGVGDLLRPMVPADAVILDVGAHAGQYTKLFAKMAPAGRVFAFEPASYARGILRTVVRWHRLRNVTIVATGLSDAPGRSTISTPIKASGSIGFGLAHLGEETRFDRFISEEVPVTTLDEFVDDSTLTRLDLVKLDVEGWEIHILRHATRSIERYRPIVLVELVQEMMDRSGCQVAEAWSIFRPRGYSSFKVTPASSLEACDGYAGPADYLFLP